MPWRDEVAAVLRQLLRRAGVRRRRSPTCCSALVEPGGRLPTTWPRATDGRARHRRHARRRRRSPTTRASTSATGPGSSTTPTPAYRFGHGLGYTDLVVTDVAAPASATQRRGRHAHRLARRTAASATASRSSRCTPSARTPRSTARSAGSSATPPCAWRPGERATVDVDVPDRGCSPTGTTAGPTSPAPTRSGSAPASSTSPLDVDRGAGAVMSAATDRLAEPARPGLQPRPERRAASTATTTWRPRRSSTCRASRSTAAPTSSTGRTSATSATRPEQVDVDDVPTGGGVWAPDHPPPRRRLLRHRHDRDEPRLRGLHRRPTRPARGATAPTSTASAASTPTSPGTTTAPPTSPTRAWYVRRATSASTSASSRSASTWTPARRSRSRARCGRAPGLKFPEAPHVYQRGDYWYLMIAEGGTERGHGVSFARGPSHRGAVRGAPEQPGAQRPQHVAADPEHRPRRPRRDPGRRLRADHARHAAARG